MSKKEENKEYKSLHLALLAAKSELEAVSKDKENPFYKSNYADINNYLSAVEPVMQNCGLVLLQPMIEKEGQFLVKTEIVHANTGESISSVLPLPTNCKPQDLGSAITYYRRYTLASLLAMRAEDDDGNKSSHKEKPQTNNLEAKTNGRKYQYKEKPQTNNLEAKTNGRKYQYDVGGLLSGDKAEDVYTYLASLSFINSNFAETKVVVSPRQLGKLKDYEIKNLENGNASMQNIKE